MNDSKQDPFVDELMDAALKHYQNAAHPWVGLEERILANLQGALRTETRPRSRTLFVAGAALTVGIIGFSLYLASSAVRRNDVRRLAQQTMPRLEAGLTAGNRALREPATAPSAPFRSQTHVRERRARPSRDAQPAQFPTPTPLTEGEKVLLQYLRTIPDRTLMAQNGNPQLQGLSIEPLRTPALKINELATAENVRVR